MFFYKKKYFLFIHILSIIKEVNGMLNFKNGAKYLSLMLLGALATGCYAAETKDVKQQTLHLTKVSYLLSIKLKVNQMYLLFLWMTLDMVN